MMNINLSKNLSDYGVKATSQIKKLPLTNNTLELPVYEIPIKHLKYNIRNGRIFMDLKKLQGDGEVDLEDLKNSNVTEFNNEIENLIWESSIERNKETMDNIELHGQIETGVVLTDGTIIDGNRRFTCLRRLNLKEPTNPEFQYFKAAILSKEDGSVSEKDIKAYELKVQFGMDQKVDYKTINFNMSIYENVKSGEFSVQEMAQTVNVKESQITLIMATGELVYEFLNYTKEPDQLSIAENLNIYWPLEPLSIYLNGNKSNRLSKVEKEQRKQLYFDYILALDISTPTQKLRDDLINKIFKNDVYAEELLDKYEKNSSHAVHSKIINSNSDIDLIQRVKLFKESEDAAQVLNDYERVREKVGIEKSLDQPIRTCENILSTLNQMNLDILLNSKTEKAILSLNRIKELLAEIEESSLSLQQQINKSQLE
jgi:hypothetical protein